MLWFDARLCIVWSLQSLSYLLISAPTKWRQNQMWMHRCLQVPHSDCLMHRNPRLSQLSQRHSRHQTLHRVWLVKEPALEFFQVRVSARVRSWPLSVLLDVYRTMWRQDHHSQLIMWWRERSLRWRLWQCLSDRARLRLFLQLHWCLILHFELHCHETLRDIEDPGWRWRKHSWSLLHIPASLPEVLRSHGHLQVPVQLFITVCWWWQVYEHHRRVYQPWIPRNAV